MLFLPLIFNKRRDMESDLLHTEEMWLEWIDVLADQDYVVIDDFISPELYRTIMHFFQAVEADDRLKKAGVGRSGELQIKEAIRGDFIYWLDHEKDRDLLPFFELMDDLNQKLRRYCYLNLSDSEFHIAKYPAGSHYSKHLDKFQDRSNRQITVLIYLNENWKPGDGGELKIYREEKNVLVEPIARRLLLFKSASVEHEVLKTRIPRYSLTGWLLRQPSLVGSLV